MFVVHRREKEYVLQRRRNRKQAKMYFVLHKNMREYLVLRWMVVDVVSCNSCVSWEFGELKPTRSVGRWSYTS